MRQQTDAAWPFWQLLNPEEKRFVRARAMERHFPAEALVQDEHGDSIGAMLVQAGRLRVYLIGSEGHEVTLHYVERGECLLLGASPQPQSLPLGVTAEAECESEVSVLSGAAMSYLMAQNPEVLAWAYRWLCAVSGRMLRAMQRVLYAGIDQRVAQSLLEQCAWRGSLSLNVTHEKLAHQASSSREVVTRTLKGFVRRGLIRTRRGQIDILMLPELERIAGCGGKRGEEPSEKKTGF